MLLAIGSAFNIAGVLLGLYGIGTTYRQHRGPDDRFWSHEMAALRRVAGWIHVIVKRLRRRRTVTVSVGTAWTAEAASNLTVVATHGALTATDVDTLRAQVEVRIADLRERDTELGAAQHDQGKRLHDLAALLTAEVSRLEGQDHRIAIGGLHLQLWGLMFVGVGTALSIAA